MEELVFHESFTSNNLQLFEVSELVLAAFISGTVRLKGETQAVLTTADETYTLKRQENSNKQYIVQAGCIFGQPSSVIKLEKLFKPTVPVSLVPKSASDQTAQSRLFTEASASDEEIRKFLRTHPEVLEEHDCFFSVSSRTKAELMRSVLMAAASLPLTDLGFDIEELWLRVSDGSEISLAGVRGLLLSVCESIDVRFARLESEKVKQVLAWQVVALNEAEYLTLEDATQLWVSALSLAPICAGETMQGLEDISDAAEFVRYGRGLFVTEECGQTLLVKRCHAATLAAEPRARLKELFAVKKKWERHELAVYLAHVLGAEAAVDNFLLKLTRQNPHGDKKIYTSLF